MNVPDFQRCFLDDESLQAHSKLMLPSGDILNQTLEVFIVKNGATVCSYGCPLSNVQDLIEGRERVVLFDGFTDTSKSKDAKKLVVAFKYLCSIFTRKMGKGEVAMTIKNWKRTSDQYDLSEETYSLMKILNDDGSNVNLQET